jgi:transcriptional regulator with XRE-family HTH domain
MHVSALLKELRVARGLSVAELAEAAAVSSPYIWQIESGRRQNPSGEKLQRLATALGVTIADLIVKGRGKRLDVRREDVEMLKHVHFRGRRPDSQEDWELVFLFLKRILG